MPKGQIRTDRTFQQNHDYEGLSTHWVLPRTTHNKATSELAHPQYKQQTTVLLDLLGNFTEGNWALTGAIS